MADVPVYGPGDTILLELDLRDESGVGSVQVAFENERSTRTTIDFEGNGNGREQVTVALTYVVPERIESGEYRPYFIETEDGLGNSRTHELPDLIFRIEAPSGDFEGPEITDARSSREARSPSRPQAEAPNSSGTYSEASLTDQNNRSERDDSGVPKHSANIPGMEVPDTKSRGHSLNLPSPKNTPPGGRATIDVRSEGPIAVVGANGSGKTRLGVWIEFESEQRDKVHRISAQKSLTMPEVASVAMTEDARMHLFYGNIESYGYSSTTPPAQLMATKQGTRWGQRPGTHLLDDFGRLLEYLVAEDYEQSTAYRRASKETGDRVEPPETKLDVVKRIWERLLPQRRLEITGNRFQAAPGGDSNAVYAATDMSDGERVVFYLIGQSLSAPEDGILLIDEPELHLHRSVQARLWDAIEAKRPDCLFVYLTHDLDFAASRIAATKVWQESYDGTNWDWHVVEEADGIPEQLYLEILGGRKPVLFCEGDKGGLEFSLFQKAYPGFTVAPCGNAYAVIQATRSFAALKHLHDHACRGIVDRDFRDDAEVEWLEGMGVSVLEQSEIENVLLTEGVLRAVADHLGFAGEFSGMLDKAKDIVFREMDWDREALISSISAAKIERRLKYFNAKARGKADLTTALDALTSSINIGVIYDETVSEIDQVIDERDYARALRLYNNKGLLGKIEPQFGFARKSMPELVKRLASADEHGSVLSALRKQLPELGG